MSMRHTARQLVQVDLLLTVIVVVGGSAEARHSVQFHSLPVGQSGGAAPVRFGIRLAAWCYFRNSALGNLVPSATTWKMRHTHAADAAAAVHNYVPWQKDSAEALGKCTGSDLHTETCPPATHEAGIVVEYDSGVVVVNTRVGLRRRSAAVLGLEQVEFHLRAETS